MISILNLLNVFRLFRQFNRCIILICFLRSLYTVVIHMNDLCIGHIHIQTTEIINDGCQCIKVYSCIIRNIQVKVCVQHCDCLFSLTIRICRIRFGIGFLVTEAHVQKCISIN